MNGVLSGEGGGLQYMHFNNYDIRWKQEAQQLHITQITDPNQKEWQQYLEESQQNLLSCNHNFFTIISARVFLPEP